MTDGLLQTVSVCQKIILFIICHWYLCVNYVDQLFLYLFADENFQDEQLCSHYITVLHELSSFKMITPVYLLHLLLKEKKKTARGSWLYWFYSFQKTKNLQYNKSTVCQSWKIESNDFSNPCSCKERYKSGSARIHVNEGKIKSTFKAKSILQVIRWLTVKIVFKVQTLRKARRMAIFKRMLYKTHA